MITVANRVGRAVLIRIRGLVTPTELTQFILGVNSINLKLGAFYSLIDARTKGTFFEPATEDVIVKVVAANNPLMIQRAFLVGLSKASDTQAQRIITRASMVPGANSLNKTTFFHDPAEMKAWAAKALTPEEAADLTKFLDEGNDL
jgi:hypothetical protein